MISRVLLIHESINQKFQVYSGHYVDPTRKGKQVNDNLAIRNGERPIQKILKERINPRTVSVEGIVNKLSTQCCDHTTSVKKLEEFNSFYNRILHVNHIHFYQI